MISERWCRKHETKIDNNNNNKHYCKQHKFFCGYFFEMLLPQIPLVKQYHCRTHKHTKRLLLINNLNPRPDDNNNSDYSHF